MRAKIVQFPGTTRTAPAPEPISQGEIMRRLVTSTNDGYGHPGLYWPTMTPMSLSDTAKVMGDSRPVYYASHLGMVYDVARALTRCSRGVRTTALLPITREHIEATDVDQARLDAMPARLVNTPGMLFTYWDAQTGAPMFQLLDGNHRYVKAAQMGREHFAVYPLTPGEIRICEYFFAIRPGQQLRRPRYRWFEQESED